MVWPAESQAAPLAATPELQGASPAAVTVEDHTRELGPFQLKDHRFTVVLHEKHVGGVAVPDPEFQTTLAEIEIKDEKDSVHYRESFSYELADNEFTDTLSASADLLQGKERSGLLLTYGTLPSTPLGGQSWQVFGLFDDKLVPFSKPIYLEGDLVSQPDGTIMKTEPGAGLQAEVLNFRVWTGNFFVIYPVRVDFLMSKAMPAWRCFRMTPQGNLPQCQYRVETDPQAAGRGDDLRPSACGSRRRNRDA